MVWQKLLGLASVFITHRLRRILNDPHAIQNLSEHHLVRRAAKYTAYLYLRGKKVPARIKIIKIKDYHLII